MVFYHNNRKVANAQSETMCLLVKQKYKRQLTRIKLK